MCAVDNALIRPKQIRRIRRCALYNATTLPVRISCLRARRRARPTEVHTWSLHLPRSWIDCRSRSGSRPTTKRAMASRSFDASDDVGGRVRHTGHRCAVSSAC